MFQKKLSGLKERGRYRSLIVSAGLDLTSNDYLGLRGHPKLRRAAVEAIESGIDLGAGGSRLLRGNHPAHEELEAFAARFFGCERALYFATGFQANYALFTTLPGRHDTVIYDSLIHASVRDGIHAGPAARIRAAHNDPDSYEDALKRARRKSGPTGRIWIAVESVYSMDGDLAPLADLYGLARRYDAFLIVDEAHGTGVFGENRKGLSEGLSHDNLITVHTCGKALGVAGGLVCASAEIIEYLINRARPFIYSTAPPPLQALLVHKALELVRDEPERRARLADLRAAANRLLPVPDSPSQIIPVVLGEDSRAVRAAESLQNAGYDIRAIRPPTVPEGTARLRLSLNVNLTEDIVADLAAHLEPHVREAAA